MIYKLRFDRSKFLVFELMPDEIEEKLGDYFLLDEPEWAGFWKPMNARFIDFSDKKNVLTPPDISCWFTQQLVLNEKAHKALAEALVPYGEFLPIKCEGIPYWILHVTKQTGLEAVDEEKSERVITKSTNKDVKKLVFKKNEVEELLLFKSEYNDYKDIFCSETFKQMVEDAGLEGLVFNTDLASIF